MNTKAAPNLDLSGLDRLSSLMSATAKPASAAGVPIKIAVDLIDEDPANARRTYDPEKLQELAESIRENGIIQPISLKSAGAGRYQVNQGHRRLRAAKLAGLSEVDAFIAESHNQITQLVENIQRENLSTAETVAAIAVLLKSMKQVEIATKLGKSRPWVSRMAALAELPPPLKAVLDNERCRDASTLYEALQCYKSDPDATTSMLSAYEAEGRQIVQSDIEDLRAAIKRKQTAPAASPDQSADSGEGTPLAQVFAPEQVDAEGTEPDQVKPLAEIFAGERAKSGASEGTSSPEDKGSDNDAPRQQNVKPSTKAEPDPTKVRKPLLQVRIGRREAVLLVNRAATEYGLVWVEYEDGSTEEVDAGRVKLVAVTEGAK